MAGEGGLLKQRGPIRAYITLFVELTLRLGLGRCSLPLCGPDSVSLSRLMFSEPESTVSAALRQNLEHGEQPEPARLEGAFCKILKKPTLHRENWVLFKSQTVN